MHQIKQFDTGLDVGQEDPMNALANFLSSHFLIRPEGILTVQLIYTRGESGAKSTSGINTTVPPRYLITLKSVWDAQLIYSQKLQKLRHKNIFISKDLTPAESNLFYKARQLKKKQILCTQHGPRMG